MFAHPTSARQWYVVEATASARHPPRLNLISHMLLLVPYEHLDEARPLKLALDSGASTCARPSARALGAGALRQCADWS